MNRHRPRTGGAAPVLRRTLPFVALLLLAACSRAPQATGGVSADEAQALNEAADMLDINSVSANSGDTAP